jgi:hypothetical protein
MVGVSGSWLRVTKLGFRVKFERWRLGFQGLRVTIKDLWLRFWDLGLGFKG